ncbi:PSP1 C-terminal conserved region-domain-containing protein [Gongronella butleri]|nr:PSP1 C-terminal conserved region-domain-containing protein [Gongronella butleri]
MGKGIPLHHFLDSNTLLYTVEFKSNRRDICYIMQDDTLAPQLHDLVLVEADRGRDLGKVVRISTANEIMDTQNPTNAATTPTNANANASDPESLAKCHVKRLFRLAEQDEIQSMETKQKEEEMALAFCRFKIIQKDLPMQVINAEFQWDRRKLTFYFKADQRIDFRELVRDLFKTYKTRIWMCALNGANDD